MSKRTVKNSGRFQAQGLKLEISEKWNKEEPITLEEGKSLLKNLKNKLSKKDKLIREDAFKKCEKYIIQANKNGGVSSVITKDFLCRFTSSERVDLEIRFGDAFVKIK